MATVELTSANFDAVTRGEGLVIRDGIALYAQPDALPDAALTQLIARARELDQVRASIAERQAAARPAGA
jgi:thioredoxin 1